MKTRFKVAVSVLVVLLMIVIINSAFTLFNMADNLANFLGVIELLVLFIIVPTVLYQTFKRRVNKNEDAKAVRYVKSVSIDSKW